MFNHQTIKVLINERLSAAAEEIFVVFERAVAEYQRDVERLLRKTVSDTKGAQRISEEFQRTEAVGEENKGNGAFVCKEETDAVEIKREDEAQMLMMTVDSSEETKWEELERGGSGDALDAIDALEPVSEPEHREELERTGSGDALDALEAVSEPEQENSDTCTNTGPPEAAAAQEPSSCSVEELDSEDLIAELSSSSIARPFVCTFCEKRFKLKITLAAHMRVHVGENPCSCPDCGVTFKKQSYLINHIHRVHTEDKPLQCPLCQKGFAHPNAFKTHMNSHTGERPFRCTLCGKGFTQKGTLKRHMVTHTGEKPFNCSKCDKNYSTKQNLTYHMAKNH